SVHDAEQASPSIRYKIAELNTFARCHSLKDTSKGERLVNEDISAITDDGQAIYASVIRLRRGRDGTDILTGIKNLDGIFKERDRQLALTVSQEHHGTDTFCARPARDLAADFKSAAQAIVEF